MCVRQTVDRVIALVCQFSGHIKGKLVLHFLAVDVRASDLRFPVHHPHGVAPGPIELGVSVPSIVNESRSGLVVLPIADAEVDSIGAVAVAEFPSCIVNLHILGAYVQ